MKADELRAAMAALGYDSGKTSDVAAFAAEVGVTSRTVYAWLRPAEVPKFTALHINHLVERSKEGAK